MAKKTETKKAGAKKSTSKSPEKSTATVAQYALLKHPILTEKSAMLSSDRNRVTFQVPRTATKTEIKAAVEAVFGVQVDAVRTLNVLGKVKRTTKAAGRRMSFKKAYVKVKEGQTIDIVEGL